MGSAARRRAGASQLWYPLFVAVVIRQQPLSFTALSRLYCETRSVKSHRVVMRYTLEPARFPSLLVRSPIAGTFGKLRECTWYEFGGSL
jgi:hypothetical protein